MDQNPSPGPQSRPPLDTAPVSAPPPPPPGYMPAMYPGGGPPPRQKGVLTKVATSIVASVMILSILANVYLAFIVFSLTAGGETVYREGDKEQRVVIVPVIGGINDEMAAFVRNAFRKIEKDVPRAVVLRVNSGGGGVTPSDQIWNTIDSFKRAHPDVPVVASFGGIAASGGYYIAAACDTIYCENTGITGSIGVMAQIPALEEMIDKLGIEMNVVVADGSELKAVANNLFEDWRNEQGELNAAGMENKAVVKNLLNSAWERFVDVVDAGRPNLDEAQVKDLATGKIFTAQQAKDVGLVNEIGYLDDALDKAIELAGLPADANPRVTVVRENSGGLLGLLGVTWGSGGAGVSGVSSGRTGLDLSNLKPDAVRTWLGDMTQVELAYRVRFE